jgi:pimeloyl-ACP methyl ester carboxylesterase
MIHPIYLHGFASSPHSGKAIALAERLAAHGLTLACPDFNEPDFSTLTVTRMIDQLETTIASLPSGPVALIGSSLGAFVALHAAERRVSSPVHPASPIDRLVMLAPALDFGGNRLKQLGDAGVTRWRESGRLEVFHYASGEMRDVGYQLYEDAVRYDSFTTTVTLPILIIQGRRDASVDPAMVERFARDRAHVELVMVDDEHQLKASIDLIWQRTESFLGLNV